MFLTDEIVKIENVDCDSLRYDITVADNHNFFANDILVHNCQNCYGQVAALFDDETWEETEKAEGSSMTVYFRKVDSEDPGTFGVASRNLDLKENDENTFWKTALELDLKNKLTALGKNIAIQGELCGPGIQGNIYQLTKHMFFVFDVFDIDKFEYFSPAERRTLTAQLGLTDVPILAKEASLKGKTCADLLFDADGQSVLGLVGCLREGLVFKANSERRISFKAVSNRYLEKQK